MKQILLAFTISILVVSSFAQCSTCTIYITGTDVADHGISIGQIMCIEPGATATGRIYVSSGGIVCNQGHINSHSVAISAGGEFDNYGIADIDTFYVYGPSSVFRNYDSARFNVSGASSGPVITNNGVWTCTSLWDTAANITNNGVFHTSQDIFLGVNSTFSNHQVFSVGRDFYNSAGGSFSTDCIVSVARDWYNSGIINGPTSGCGGFSITGLSYNSGIVGDTGHIDICDAGHPPGGTDGNSGTMTGVTYCQCQNACTTMVGINETSGQVAFSVYPNPATDKVQITFADKTEGTVRLQNLLGKILQETAINDSTKEIILNTSALSNGIYVLTLETSSGRTWRKIEIMK